jgi:hypothetical protein
VRRANGVLGRRAAVGNVSKVTGALIMESLRVGTVLEGAGLVVRRLSRDSPADVTREQPPVWTLMEFGSDAADPERLAEELAAVLDSPGWYANLYSAGQVFVNFSSKVFRYDREDDAGHEQAVAYAQTVGVPIHQCDWR